MIEAATLVAFLFGTIIGSFLNVVIVRLPLGRSVVSPRSACQNCGHQLRWFENIPIVSWLALRARCRQCKNPISIRYIVVELVTGLLFSLVTYLYLSSGGILVIGSLEIVELWILLTFFAYGVTLASIDFATSRLPTRIILLGFLSVSALFLLSTLISLQIERLTGAFIGSALLGLFFLLIHFVRPDGMGRGDVNLAFFLGLVLGWYGFASVITGVFLAFLFGSIFGISIVIAGKGSRKSTVPFGPWMIAGAWAALGIGEPIWRWYLDVSGIFA